MAISNTFLLETATPVYTSNGATAMVVGYLCNVSQEPITFSLYLVSNGGIAEATNTIYSNVNLTADDTYVIDTEKIVFDDGDSLWAQASVSNVVAVSLSTVII